MCWCARVCIFEESPANSVWGDGGRGVFFHTDANAARPLANDRRAAQRAASPHQDRRWDEWNAPDSFCIRTAAQVQEEEPRMCLCIEELSYKLRILWTVGANYILSETKHPAASCARVRNTQCDPEKGKEGGRQQDSTKLKVFWEKLYQGRFITPLSCSIFLAI